MKKSFSIRTIILFFLLGFAILVSAMAAVAIQVSRYASYSHEIQSLQDDLVLLAHQLVKDWEEEDRDPYSLMDDAFSLQNEAIWTYYYMLQDADGIILAPKALEGRHFLIEKKRAFAGSFGGDAILGTVQGKKAFVVPYVFEYKDKSYTLSGVYEDTYIFGDRKATVRSFLLVLSALLAILLCLCGFWIIPRLQRLVHKKNMAEEELLIAQKLQQRAVTQQFPQDPRVDAYGTLQTMKEVGGDFYGCSLHGNNLHLTMGDVSGKGIEAAFVMFLVSSYLYSRRDQWKDISRLVGECNTLLYANRDYECFCTLLLASLNLESFTLDYCNAGHMRMILNGEFVEEDPQMVVGGFPDYPFANFSIQLQKGSRLVLYTDGVTEARNEKGEFFGNQRLLSFARSFPADASSQDFCNALLQQLAEFRGNARQNDDIAILSVKI